jgi:ATP-binding cassette, subfamily B, bacterial PglK
LEAREKVGGVRPLAAVAVLLDGRQRRATFFLFLGTLVAAALEMIGIGAIPAYVTLLTDPDRLLANVPDRLASPLIGMQPITVAVAGASVLTAMFVLKNSFIAAFVFAENRILRDLTVALSGRLFRAYIHSPFTFHLRHNPAQLVRNVSTEAGSAVQVIRSGILALREGLVLLVVFLLLSVVDPVVSLSVFTLLAATAAAFYLSVRRSLAVRGEIAQEHRARQVQTVNQGLGAIKDVKILGREDYIVDLFDRETRGTQRHEAYQRVVGSLPRLFLEVMAVAAVLVVATIFVVTGRPVQLMVPVLTLLAVAVVRMVPAFNAITASLAGIRYFWPALDLISRDLTELEEAAEADANGSQERWPRMRGGIALRDVRYMYPESPVEVVRGISLVVQAGEAVAFIGRSGAGKTTLVNLIMGLLSPTAGEIRVDDRDIREMGSGWQRQIGYIPQDTYLLDDTIRRNIGFGLPEERIDADGITRAVKAAQLEDFIAGLPHGLDTVVGDRGVRLSGGQRQRIAIARALYPDPSVLVLDEATSALDSETERAVIEAIGGRGGRTILVIAHRLTTVLHCDRVFLLDEGRVSDCGAYAELAARHPYLQLQGTPGRQFGIHDETGQGGSI